jgi:hypothetical protein
VSKCIHINIPGFEDDPIYFDNIADGEGASLHTSAILNDIVSHSSEANETGLKILEKLVKETKFKYKPFSLIDLDANDIGNNYLGNATIDDLSKMLFRVNPDKAG